MTVARFRLAAIGASTTPTEPWTRCHRSPKIGPSSRMTSRFPKCSTSSAPSKRPATTSTSTNSGWTPAGGTRKPNATTTSSTTKFAKSKTAPGWNSSSWPTRSTWPRPCSRKPTTKTSSLPATPHSPSIRPTPRRCSGGGRRTTR
uniref:(northern house mosquito) hypothetical protein n=1 Tax=Culex pipiens TaxID=7175 RepID=A0A8D8A3L2_CULPI